MTRGSRAACCIPQSLSNDPVTSIWISDALLANIYKRFTYQHRRDSSSAPGPLEARRRASKRKNASLAYREARNAQLDTAFPPPNAPPLGWWHKPNPPLAKPVIPRFVPSWFIEPPDLPIHHGDFQHTAVDIEGTESTLGRNVLQHDQSAILDRGLERSQNVGDIHQLLGQLDLNLHRYPDVSERIFAHMLKVDWKDSDLAEYLESPLLNPVGSDNHLKLINHLHLRLRNHKEWNILFKALCKATQLGLITPKSFEGIIRFLPWIQLKCEKGSAHIRSFDEVHRESLYLLRALEESKVLGVDDLQASFVRDWFSRVCNDPMSSSGVKLLWNLRKFVGVKQKQQQSGSKLLVQLLKSVHKRDRSTTPAAFAELLLLIPTQELISSVFQATNLLVIESQQGEIDASLFQFWHDALSSFNNEAVTNICLSVADLTEALAVPYINLNPEERLLILAWTVFSMSMSQEVHRNQLNKLEFRQKFDDTFGSSTGRLTQDLLGRVVLCLQRLSLPHKEQLVENLRYFTDDRLVIADGLTTLESDIDNLTSRVFSRLADNSFYLNVKTNYNDALVELAESVNEDIEQFKTFSRALIHKNKTTFKVVTRILNHNRAFQLALSQSFPQRIAWKRNKDAESGIYCSKAESQLQPEETLDAINHLAVSFALSNVIGSRSALRKVYWCFIFLHRYGAPIQAPVTRALWHAGVTRYGSDGTSVATLKWLLKQIEAVEGKEVARSLLLSSTFRNQRRCDLEVFDWSDCDLQNVPAELKGDNRYLIE